MSAVEPRRGDFRRPVGVKITLFPRGVRPNCCGLFERWVFQRNPVYRVDPYVPYVCGAEVPAKAKACPECGADEKTGWSEETIYDGTGIEDPDEFDYQDWERREGVGRPSGRQIWIWIVAVVMLGLSIFLLLRS